MRPDAEIPQEPRELNELREVLDRIDEELLDIIRRRIDCCVRIGLCKRREEIPMMQTGRIEIVKTRAHRFGRRHGVDPQFLDTLYDVIVAETCRVETAVMASGEAGLALPSRTMEG